MEELKRDPAQSDRSIAKKAKVDKNVVTRERERLQEGGALHHQHTRIGADGVAQPAKKRVGIRVTRYELRPCIRATR